MITINQSKCIGCGQCVNICPFTVLKMNDAHKAEVTEKHCLECMHCAIICPVQTITFDGENVIGEEVKELPENTADIVENLIKQRRSYRKFETRKVPRVEITEMITSASLVASAKNTHPTKWLVLDDESEIKGLMDIIESFCRTNQVSPEIIAELENDNNPVVGEHASLLIGICKNDALDPIHDTAIAMTSIELMMQSRGIGTCWGGYLLRYLNNIPECRKFIGLSEDMSVCGTLMFGYPKQNKYRYLPKRLAEVELQYGVCPTVKS